jgi:hypothetical protein
MTHAIGLARASDMQLLDEEVPMPLYMDVHHGIADLTPEVARLAHEKDLAVQQKCGVRYLRRLLPLGRARAPIPGRPRRAVPSAAREAATAVHRSARAGSRRGRPGSMSLGEACPGIVRRRAQ